MPKLSIQEKKAALQSQIAELEAQEQANTDAKNLLIGQIVAAEIEQNDELKRTVNALLEKGLKKNADRQLFGFEKLPSKRGRPALQEPANQQPPPLPQNS